MRDDTCDWRFNNAATFTTSGLLMFDNEVEDSSTNSRLPNRLPARRARKTGLVNSDLFDFLTSGSVLDLWANRQVTSACSAAWGSAMPPADSSLAKGARRAGDYDRRATIAVGSAAEAVKVIAGSLVFFRGASCCWPNRCVVMFESPWSNIPAIKFSSTLLCPVAASWRLSSRLMA